MDQPSAKTCMSAGSNHVISATSAQSSPSSQPSLEESLEQRIERLSRERPQIFATPRHEILFVFSIAMSQFLTEYFVSGFTLILPTVVDELGISHSASVWPAMAFSLVVASTLLVFGRLVDMWGGYPIFIGGLSWLMLWSVVTGFSVNPLMLNFCRALQGLGATAILPSGVMLMGSIYRPGRRKNLMFAIYGTSAVMGFFGGIFFAGLVGDFLRWGFYFWIGAMFAGLTLATSVVSVPTKIAPPSELAMDYLGAVSIVSGLVLTVFSITQSANTPDGWRTTYVPVCFALGIFALCVAVYVETRIAKHPLLPASIFTTPAMTPLVIALLMLYGTWGIFSVYGTFYFQNVLSARPLQIVAWYTPIGVAGLIFSVLEGFILHVVPGKVLLVVSGLGAFGSQLLLALMPLDKVEYWPWIFPATVLSTLGIDISTILATVFITTTFPLAQQGLAGGVINSVLQLGVALVLGLSDILQTKTVGSVGLAKSYKNTYWFGVALGAASLIVLAIWGKVPKATGDLTADEKEELLREARNEQQRADHMDADDVVAIPSNSQPQMVRSSHCLV